MPSVPAGSPAGLYTIAGGPNVATNALLGGIVAIDGQDNLYIGDSSNSIVREVTATTSSVNFGSVVLGSPVSQAFTLTNNGSTSLLLGNLNVEGDFVQQFGTGSATGPADCLPNTTLTTGASCLAEMAFTPIQTGAAPGMLTIASNSVNAANGANVIDLAGTGQGLGGTAAQTITFGALQDTAYGATVALSATASSGLPVSFLVNGPATLTTTAQRTFLKTTGAGTVVAVTAYQIGDTTTYKAASPVVQSLTVTPFPLTVAAGPQSITLGSAIPDLSRDFTVAGLITGDTTGGLPALSTTATASSPCGAYPVHITQGSLTFSSGYAANFVDSSLYITGTAQTGAQAADDQLQPAALQGELWSDAHHPHRKCKLRAARLIYRDGGSNGLRLHADHYQSRAGLGDRQPIWKLPVSGRAAGDADIQRRAGGSDRDRR